MAQIKYPASHDPALLFCNCFVCVNNRLSNYAQNIYQWPGQWHQASPTVRTRLASMRLDVYLKDVTKVEIDELPQAVYVDGQLIGFTEPVQTKIGTQIVYHGSLTHNLKPMADAIGCYEALWEPETLKIKRPDQLVPLLIMGIKKLEKEPELYKLYNPENGWGNYYQLLDFMKQYLHACKQYPFSKIEVSR